VKILQADQKESTGKSTDKQQNGADNQFSSEMIHGQAEFSRN